MTKDKLSNDLEGRRRQSAGTPSTWSTWISLQKQPHGGF